MLDADERDTSRTLIKAAQAWASATRSVRVCIARLLRACASRLLCPAPLRRRVAEAAARAKVAFTMDMLGAQEKATPPHPTSHFETQSHACNGRRCEI
eukprot:400271-Pleurochrysis_carterae.AAC.2